eukprot:g22487.t1
MYKILYTNIMETVLSQHQHRNGTTEQANGQGGGVQSVVRLDVAVYPRCELVYQSANYVDIQRNSTIVKKTGPRLIYRASFALCRPSSPLCGNLKVASSNFLFLAFECMHRRRG